MITTIPTIISVSIVPLDQVFHTLRYAYLENAGDEKVRPYLNANFRMTTYQPFELNPTALYVLEKRLEVQRELRKTLLERFGIDVYRLPSVINIKFNDETISMVPPVVEIYEEHVSVLARQGDRKPLQQQAIRISLLLDGLHRMWCAKETGNSIRCLAVWSTTNRYLPYAYPNEWKDIRIRKTVPGTKKYYRRKDPYTFMRPLSALRFGGIAEYSRNA